jgi:hypothetical protein
METPSFLSSAYHKRIGHLRGKITMFAYEKIKVEITFAWQHDNIDTCNCTVRNVYRIPCRHQLPPEPSMMIPLSMIDSRWYVDPVVMQNENANRK